MPYPSLTEAIAAATSGFNIIRSGAVQTQLPLFAKNVYDVLGYAIGVTIGEPTPLYQGVAETDDLSAIYRFADALDEIDLPPAMYASAATDPSAIDPATLMMIVQLAVQLIELIRKRRNP